MARTSKGSGWSHEESRTQRTLSALSFPAAFPDPVLSGFVLMLLSRDRCRRTAKNHSRVETVLVLFLKRADSKQKCYDKYVF